MKTIRTSNDPTTDKKAKRETINKLQRLATKTKLFIKNHFPMRIWPKPQEKNKGRKF